MIIINSYKMKEYFEKFDYLKLKYSPLLKGIDKDKVPLIYKEFLNFERAKHHSLYNNINYADIKKRIKLIYNSEKEAEDFIFFYDFALDQLVDRFLNIPSLDKLFSHHYFEFEWQQHIDMDFNKNDLSFYRDHFIHQIRNCYMLLTLLDSPKENGLLNKVISIFKTRHNELSKYACVQIEQYKEHIKSVVNATIRKLNDKISQTELDDINDKISNSAEEYAWQYFVRGSLIVASLFHDIGYPIMFMHSRAKQLNDYLSAFVPADNVGFDNLNNLLEESLLFMVYEKKELALRYHKFDHGALSAYIFLLQFYETGAIHSLNPIKKAIIEFAALIIYDHTLKYKISEDDNSLRDKPSFFENPLSYLLRAIDDIQEWDRIYFEIRSNSDLRYCEKCKMPISRIWNSDIESCFEALGKLHYLTHSSMRKIYACGCSKEYQGKKELGYYAEKTAIEKAIKKKLSSYHFSSGMFENGSLFAYQKLNYTITSKQIYFLENKNGLEKIYIDYDAFMQLYLLTINPKALEYRIGELAKINDQFKLQRGINVKVYAYLSDNPFMLKMRILCNFLYEIGHYIYVQSTKKPRYTYNPIYKDAVKIDGENFDFSCFYKFAQLLKKKGFFVYDYSDEDDIVIENSEAQVLKVDEFNDYIECIIKYLMQSDDTTFVQNLINTCKQLIKIVLNTNDETKMEDLCNFKYIDEIHKDACGILVEDAISQLKHQQNDTIDTYYNERKENLKIGYALDVILNKKYYDPRIIREESLNTDKLEFFDVYSDLYLFKEMYRFSMDNYERRTQSNK